MVSLVFSFGDGSRLPQTSKPRPRHAMNAKSTPKMSVNRPEAAAATPCHSTMQSVMNADPNAKRLMTTANMRKDFLIPMSFDPFMSSSCSNGCVLRTEIAQSAFSGTVQRHCSEFICFSNHPDLCFGA